MAARQTGRGAGPRPRTHATAGHARTAPPAGAGGGERVPARPRPADERRSMVDGSTPRAVRDGGAGRSGRWGMHAAKGPWANGVRVTRSMPARPRSDRRVRTLPRAHARGRASHGLPRGTQLPNGMPGDRSPHARGRPPQPRAAGGTVRAPSVGRPSRSTPPRPVAVNGIAVARAPHPRVAPPQGTPLAHRVGRVDWRRRCRWRRARHPPAPPARQPGRAPCPRPRRRWSARGAGAVGGASVREGPRGARS